MSVLWSPEIYNSGLVDEMFLRQLIELFPDNPIGRRCWPSLRAPAPSMGEVPEEEDAYSSLVQSCLSDVSLAT